MKKPALEFKDVLATVGALEMWVDAFSDDPDFTDDAERVKRVLKELERIAAYMEEKGGLLAPTKPEDVN